MRDALISRRTLAASTLALGAAVMAPRLIQVAARQADTDADAAIEAATFLSQLEVDEQIWPLYMRIHPDAREIVPYYAVEYWYANAFTPRGPEVIEPTGVTFVDWTWGVTGVTYPGTAEVAFTQAFADGSEVEDVVRLVRVDDEWSWFFGRDRAFVDEQIELAGADLYPGESAAAPDWAEPLTEVDSDALDTLPSEYPGEQDAAIRTGAGDGGFRRRVYAVQEGYTVATIEYLPMGPDEAAADRVRRRLESAERAPGFEVLAWDVEDGAELSFATFRFYAGEANGNAFSTVVANRATGHSWEITAPTVEEIDALGGLLVS